MQQTRMGRAGEKQRRERGERHAAQAQTESYKTQHNIAVAYHHWGFKASGQGAEVAASTRQKFGQSKALLVTGGRPGHVACPVNCRFKQMQLPGRRPHS